MAPRKALDERAVVELYRSGASLEELAEKYGCSCGTVRNVLIRLGVARRGPGRAAKPIDPEKTCSSCQRVLPRADFYGNGKRTSECRTCISEKAHDLYHSDPEYRRRKIASAEKWQREHPDAARARKRLWSSGWSQERFDAAWEAQGGRCAICQTPMRNEGSGKLDSVHADHDHTTGKPRDLLCAKCNRHLGIFEKNLDAFTAYLQKHGVKR